MKIAIVEDNETLLGSLKLLLDGEPDITVAGAFGSAEDALKGIGKSSPDIMLVDLGLPGMSGVELIKRVKEKMPEVEIMAHTIFEDKENVFSAKKAATSDYLIK